MKGKTKKQKAGYDTPPSIGGIGHELSERMRRSQGRTSYRIGENQIDRTFSRTNRANRIFPRFSVKMGVIQHQNSGQNFIHTSWTTKQARFNLVIVQFLV